MKKILKYFFLVLMVVAIVIGYLYWKGSNMTVTGDSMLPTYKKGQKVSISDNDDLCYGCIVIYKGKLNDKKTLLLHRVIGMPNDKITFIKGVGFFVNNKQIHREIVGNYQNSDSMSQIKFIEVLDGYRYQVLGVDISISTSHTQSQNSNIPNINSEDCTISHSNGSLTCVVRGDSVFVVGDNRENTLYGLVKIDNILGIVD